MKISELFPGARAGTDNRLDERLAAAVADRDAAQDRATELLVDDLSGKPVDRKAVQATEKQLDQLNRDIALLEAAKERVARDKAKRAQAQERENEKRRWVRIEAKAKKRRDLAVTLQVSLANFARARDELLIISADMYNDLPKSERRVSVAGTTLGMDWIDAQIRLAMREAGVGWAANTPRYKTPLTVEELVQRGNDLALSARPADDD